MAGLKIQMKTGKTDMAPAAAVTAVTMAVMVMMVMAGTATVAHSAPVITRMTMAVPAHIDTLTIDRNTACAAFMGIAAAGAVMMAVAMTVITCLGGGRSQHDKAGGQSQKRKSNELFHRNRRGFEALPHQRRAGQTGLFGSYSAPSIFILRSS